MKKIKTLCAGVVALGAVATGNAFADDVAQTASTPAVHAHKHHHGHHHGGHKKVEQAGETAKADVDAKKVDIEKSADKAVKSGEATLSSPDPVTVAH